MSLTTPGLEADDEAFHVITEILGDGIPNCPWGDAFLIKLGVASGYSMRWGDAAGPHELGPCLMAAAAPLDREHHTPLVRFRGGMMAALVVLAAALAERQGVEVPAAVLALSTRMIACGHAEVIS